MPNVTLIIETITPLLMAGANDPSRHNLPEIRGASWRGILRYWLRALVGAHVQANLKELNDRESEYFGNTSQGSVVSLRIILAPDIQNYLFDSPQRNLVPPDRVPFDGFTQGAQFQISLFTHPLAKEFPLPVLAAILLASRLGAGGKRSRRGAGSIRVIHAQTTSDDGVVQEITKVLRRKPRTEQDFVRYLREDIDIAEALMQRSGLAPNPSRFLPKYPVFNQENTRVLVGQPYDSYRQAINSMWFIRIQPQFHDELIFGTPRQNLRVRERRASPVHMRVGVSVSPLRFHPVMTIFRSEPERDWSVLQRFISVSLSQGFQQIYGVETW